MVRRTVLTSRQRSALFSLPEREADLLRHYTLSDEDLENINARRRIPVAGDRTAREAKTLNVVFRPLPQSTRAWSRQACRRRARLQGPGRDRGARECGR